MILDKYTAYCFLPLLSFTSAAMDSAKPSEIQSSDVLNSKKEDYSVENEYVYDFYSSIQGVSGKNQRETYYINDFLDPKFDFEKFRNNEFIIAWLFPTPFPVAPDDSEYTLLTPQQNAKMKENPHVIAYLYFVLLKFFEFWGLWWKKDENGQDEIHVAEEYDFLKSINQDRENDKKHFYRMLIFLNCMGMHQLAEKIFHAVTIHPYENEAVKPSNQMIQLWKEGMEYRPPWDKHPKSANANLTATATAAAAAANIAGTAVVSAAASAAVYLLYQHGLPSSTYSTKTKK